MCKCLNNNHNYNCKYGIKMSLEDYKIRLVKFGYKAEQIKKLVNKMY